MTSRTLLRDFEARNQVSSFEETRVQKLRNVHIIKFPDNFGLPEFCYTNGIGIFTNPILLER